MGSCQLSTVLITPWTKQQKMVKTYLTVFIAVIVNHLDKVDGKQCYDCKVISGENQSDDCGYFDQRTPQCRVSDDGDCLTTTITGSGQKFEVHSCDVLADCKDQKNRCVSQEGTTQCCCDGELCNSDHPSSATFPYGSLFILLPAFLVM